MWYFQLSSHESVFHLVMKHYVSCLIYYMKDGMSSDGKVGHVIQKKFIPALIIAILLLTAP